jgi:sn-glycerol 3-phosphate transport system substrate-binding protein
MSANFAREYVINDEVDAFDPLIERSGKTQDAFMDEFWPALKPNAIIARHVYGIPFQNSTPLLYYNVAAFTEAGLDPDHPPVQLGRLDRCGKKSWRKPKADRRYAGA